MSRPASKSACRPRSSYLAPPPLLLESEAFEGAALLQEQPGPLGVVLWKSLRDVSLWTCAEPRDRAALFGAGAADARAGEISAAAQPELWAPLLVIARVVAEPVNVDERRLVHACRTIAEWGRRQGATAVQLAFTQAAARLLPDEPKLAYAVGRLARDRGEYARGESWLRASISLARNHDWQTYALGYLSLGTLYQTLGNLPAARIVTLRGLRTTRRRRLGSLAGTAFHNLFVLASEAGDYGRAQNYAAAAIRRYGASHPALPALAYDLALLWFLEGRFGQALPVLEAVLPHIPAGLDRVLALSSAARAAAGAGDRPRFEQYWDATVQESLPFGSHATVAQAWLTLARGAVSLRELPRVQEAAGHAREIAELRSLAQIRMECESVLQSGRSPVAATDSEVTKVAEFGDELARQMIESLAPRYDAGLAAV
jgi:tetratricopeptide (TPR) repeat protein